jgi:LAO/AO transport system kinase
LKGLAERILAGDEGSAARLITLIEERKKTGYEELARLLPHTGKAHILGLTGPAGAGKSTLIAQLTGRLCDQGKKVGIIAIDPTSVESQGAFLGDRVRMKAVERPGTVFIRSMADREHPGGICRATLGAVYVIESLGKDILIIESVGAGQSDKALSHVCDTVVTLFTPEFGDELQLLKAGLIEIGDIIVVNKWDKADSDDVVNAISTYVRDKGRGTWSTPILRTTAHTGEGVGGLVDVLEARWAFLQKDKEIIGKRKQRTIRFMMTLLKDEIWQRFLAISSKGGEYKLILEKVDSGAMDPYSAVERIADAVARRLKQGE